MRIVCLPGLHGKCLSLDSLTRELAPQLKLTAVQYPDSVHNYSALERVVENYLPANEQFLLAAESFSGPLALKIASRQDEFPGLKGVVLLGAFVTSPYHKWVSHLFSKGLIGVFLSRPWMPVIFGKLLFGIDIPTREVHDFYRSLKDLGAEGITSRLQEMLNVKMLPRISLPLLYIDGGNDKLEYVVPASVVKGQLSGVSDHWKYVTINGASHMIAQMHPQETAREILSFLREIERITVP